MIRTLLLLCSIIWLSGCVGAAVVLPHTKHQRWPDQGVRPVTLNLSSPQTKLAVIQHHNDIPPTLVYEEKGQEVWEYQRENSWCGAVILFVPLVLPVCGSGEIYYFKENQVTEHTTQDVKMHGLMCSLFLICPENADCSACLVQ